DLRRRELLDRNAARPPAVEPDCPVACRELGHILEEEVHRLPEKLRLPILLCYWEGKTNAEAARQLGWAAGTVKTPLARAPELPRGRLTRRGVTLPAGAVALLLAPRAAEATLPPALVRAATGAASARAAVLAQGLAQGAALSRLKLGALLALTLGVIV